VIKKNTFFSQHFKFKVIKFIYLFNLESIKGITALLRFNVLKIIFEILLFNRFDITVLFGFQRKSKGTLFYIPFKVGENKLP